MSRSLSYRRLENPFEPQRVFSADQVAAVHDGALRILETQGMKVLSPRARKLYAAGGAQVDDASNMVRLDRGLVASCLSSAPRSFTLHSVDGSHHVPLSGRTVAFAPSSGAPNIMDIERGRRAGTLADFCDGMKLCESLDVIHVLGSMCEPQDIAPPLRHLEVIRAQLTLSDKIPFTFSRGIGQVADCFEALRIMHGISADDFRSRPCTYTIINTNSPLQLDLPRARRSARRPFACANRAPRGAGRLRQLHFKRRHEIRLPRLWHTGVRQGPVRCRPDGAPPRVAVALLERDRIERAGRTGRL
jgi:trimethylamine--corrinoid protein Co-methyltransferase